MAGVGDRVAGKSGAGAVEEEGGICTTVDEVFLREGVIR